jgi:Ran GTPase-activating protein (RanGAP) involved in mRNA processing and transport
MPALQVLHVLYIRMQAPHVEALVRQCATLRTLTELQLCDNSIDCEAAGAMAPHLGALSALQSLSLRYNSIGPMGAKHLAAHLPRVTALRCLVLRANPMQTEGMSALLVAAAELKCLSALDISHCSVDGNDPGFQDLQCLAAVHALQELDLSENSLRAPGARSLAQALPSLTSLQKLYLRRTRIGARGAEALRPAFAKLLMLRELDLAENFIDSDTAKCLLQSLFTLPLLRTLFTGCTEFDRNGPDFSLLRMHYYDRQ